MKQPIEKALEIARANIKEIRTVNEWAKEMGYNNPKYFSHVFKRNYGSPPKLKLVEIRIAKFFHIIDNNANISCFEIAFKLGIGDEKDLNRYI